MEPGVAGCDAQNLDQYPPGLCESKPSLGGRLNSEPPSGAAVSIGAVGSSPKGFCPKDGMSSKNEIVTKLKDELDRAIVLVVKTREVLELELFGDPAWKNAKPTSVDKLFVTKLRELTASFNSLTESKIRLDKAEKAMEADLTPAEERAAVVGYLATIPWNDAQKVFSEAQFLRKSLE